MLAENIGLIAAHNGNTAGFLVVTAANHDEVHGYVWEHRLTDGTTTWVAEKPGAYAGNGGGIPGFQSEQWAAQFLYDRAWPQYIRREDGSGRPDPECTVNNLCGSCSICQPDLAARGIL